MENKNDSQVSNLQEIKLEQAMHDVLVFLTTLPKGVTPSRPTEDELEAREQARKNYYSNRQAIKNAAATAKTAPQAATADKIARRTTNIPGEN